MNKDKYINPFTDFGFKKLFGTATNKHFLISFLNSLFDLEDKITEIQYQNVEQLGMDSRHRNAIFDLYCTTESGAHIIVEMQNAYQRFFIDRSIFYSSFPIQESGKKGEDWNFELPKIFTVAFLNFNMNDYVMDPNFMHTVKLVDLNTNTVFYNKLTYIYLEMRKFDKEIDLSSLENIKDITDQELIFDIWMYLIKYLDKFKDMPSSFQGSLFEKFFEVAEINAFSNEERMAYEKSLKNFRDSNNIVTTAEWVGENRKLKVMAANLLKMGFDLEAIAKVAEVSVEEVKKALDEGKTS